MTTNLQNSPYLPKQRNFPNEDANVLGVALDKTYIEIASKVNERTIGIYAVNYPMATGEQWFIQGQPQKQQTLRQAYSFNSTTNIPHGIRFNQIDRMTRMYGQYSDDVNWYGLIAGSSVAITGQISFYLDITNIVFVVDGAAPTLKEGTIVLEWLSEF